MYSEHSSGKKLSAWHIRSFAQVLCSRAQLKLAMPVGWFTNVEKEVKERGILLLIQIRRLSCVHPGAKLSSISSSQSEGFLAPSCWVALTLQTLNNLDQAITSTTKTGCRYCRLSSSVEILNAFLLFWQREWGGNPLALGMEWKEEKKS